MNLFPILYSFRRCPYAMRARMALHYAGIQCEVREVVLKEKPQALLDISPKATVPVLQLPDGGVIDESLDIMLWALTQHDPELWMPPAEQYDDVIALVHRNDSEFKYHLDRYKYPQRFDDDGQDHGDLACQFLTELERRLLKSTYLFGNSISLADIALFPFVRQFAAVDRQAFELLAFPYLKQWLSAWLSDARFQAVMCKRIVWQPGDKISLLLHK